MVNDALDETLTHDPPRTFDGTVLKGGDQLASTKKEGGIGLQSVKAVVERYGDIFYFDYDDQWFKACVCWGKGGNQF